MLELTRQSPNPEYIAELSRLALAAERGQFENLECPSCHAEKVCVWFTNPAADFYRTWFICSNCEFHTRAQNAQRPCFFTEERRHQDLEDRDRAILHSGEGSVQKTVSLTILVTSWNGIRPPRV